VNKENLLKKGFQFFGILILCIFVVTIDHNKVKEALSLLDILIIVELVLVMLCLITVRALRWKYIVKALTRQDISLYFSIISIVCGVAAGSLVPGRLDAAKPLMLKNHFKIDLKTSTSGMLIERLADIQSLIILFVISIIGMFVLGEVIQRNLLLILVIFPAFLLLLYLYPEKMYVVISRLLNRLPLKGNIKSLIHSFINEVFLSLETINNKKTLSAVILISIVSMLLEVVRIYIILNALDIEVSMIETSFFFSTAVLIGVLSLIPGAIGIYEISSAKLIESISDSDDIGLIKSAVLIDRVIAYYALIVLGGLFISMNKYLFKEWGGDEK